MNGDITEPIFVRLWIRGSEQDNHNKENRKYQKYLN